MSIVTHRRSRPKAPPLDDLEFPGPGGVHSVLLPTLMRENVVVVSEAHDPKKLDQPTTSLDIEMDEDGMERYHPRKRRGTPVGFQPFEPFRDYAMRKNWVRRLGLERAKRLVVCGAITLVVSAMVVVFFLLSLSISVNLKYRVEQCREKALRDAAFLSNLTLEPSISPPAHASHVASRGMLEVADPPSWNISSWGQLKLNHFRILGTHNSYHLASTALPLRPHQYTHPPLEKQLGWYDHGVRQIELDVHLVDDMFVVYHLHFLDDATTCYCLSECFAQVKAWSDQHPSHFPVYVFIEIKSKIWEDVITALSGFNEGHLDALEREILSIFPRDRLITPDTVRGAYPLVKDSLLAAMGPHPNDPDAGWPRLAASLGKFMFVWLDDVHDIASSVPSISKDPALTGRLFFIAGTRLDQAYASIIVINNPRQENYRKDVKIAQEKGMMVRSMADSPYNLLPDPDRFLMLMEGGANIIATDFECINRTDEGYAYRIGREFTRSPTHANAELDASFPAGKTAFPEFDPRDPRDYCETLPSGWPFECNPLTAPVECAALELERRPLQGLRTLVNHAVSSLERVPSMRPVRPSDAGEGWIPWMAGLVGM